MSNAKLKPFWECWRDRALRRLCWALLISLLLHLFWFEHSHGWKLPKDGPSRLEIVANLKRLSPEKHAKPSLNDPQSVSEEALPLPKPSQQSQPLDRSTLPVMPPTEERRESAVKPLPVNPDPLPIITSEGFNQDGNESSQVQVETPLSHDSQQLLQPDAPAIDEQAIPPMVDEEADDESLADPPYTYVQTEFNVYINHEEERAGTARITYQMDEEQNYQLQWEIKATGLLALFYPDLIQVSQGNVTGEGLKPLQYQYQLENKPSKSYTVAFDWKKLEASLSKENQMHLENLHPDSQDMLSFMFQFMFEDPLENMRVHMTNGKRFAEYDYEFVGEETLELQFANVKTYHIRHSKLESEDKTELWLAKDYHFVPVKIQKTEKNGTVIEQIAFELLTKLNEKELLR